jgi:hypothetical protein
MTKKLTVNIIRYFIAFVLLSTAIGKLLDNRGFAEIIESYLIFSGNVALSLGLLLSLTELALSIWLFSGIKLKFASLGSAALHSLFLGWLLFAMFRGLELANCGCFGVFLARPLGWFTVFEDVFMLFISIILYFLVRKEETE